MTMHSSDVSSGNDGTATQYNNLRKDVRNAVKDPQTDNSGAFDLSTGAIQIRTLDGTNGTLSISNAQAGQSFLLILKQDGSGNRTVTWFTSPGAGNPAIKWVGAAAPSLTPTGDRTDIFAFFYDGADLYGSIVGQNYG